MSALAEEYIGEDEILESMLKEATSLRIGLNSLNNKFRYNENVRGSFTLEYNRSPYYKRESAVFEGECGTTSDCYILYVISRYGCCDLDTIIRTLERFYKVSSGNLSIISSNARDAFRHRIKALMSNGFITRTCFNLNQDTLHVSSGATKEKSFLVSLYAIDRMSYGLLNNKLGKHVSPRDWIQAKRDFNQIGIAASGFVSSYLINSPEFVDFGDGMIKTRELGEASVDNELVFKKGKVGVISSFLNFDRSVMLEKDYKDDCVYRLNLIRNYFHSRLRGDKEAYMVIVCQDNEDLIRMATLVHDAGALEEYQGRIYYTGEGAVKHANGDMRKALMSLNENSSSKNGFSIINPTAKFL